MRLLLVHSFLLAIAVTRGAVTAYSPHVQQPLGTVSAASVSYTGAATYDDVTLTPLPVPNPPPPTSFGVELQTRSVPGLLIPQQGSFFGFSIEISVVAEVLGLNSSFLQVPFLTTRVALINFVDDSSGASDYTASISIGGSVPSQVAVKYLSAASVTQKFNITWAGQTFGGAFSSDERPGGAVDVQTINCDQTNNVCKVTVPAPGAALVFLSDQTLSESNPGPTMTFPTTIINKSHNTATIDPAVLATSNGNKVMNDELAGTTQGGGINSAFGFTQALPSVGALIAGALLVTRMTMRW